MKYHKIRNVEKTVCTAEQKIAYNLAFRAYTTFGDKWNDMKDKVTEAERLNFIAEVRDFEIKQCTYQDWYKNNKYDNDAIFCCLNAGLRNYMDNYFIACDYVSIGKAFPAHYLK